MSSIFLILFSILLSPAAGPDRPLYKISKAQLQDPKNIVYIVKKISKNQLKAPGDR
jgi:hypothetical protein